MARFFVPVQKGPGVYQATCTIALNFFGSSVDIASHYGLDGPRFESH
jgi:hypothetical protein